MEEPILGHLKVRRTMANSVTLARICEICTRGTPHGSPGACDPMSLWFLVAPSGSRSRHFWHELFGSQERKRPRSAKTADHGQQLIGSEIRRHPLRVQSLAKSWSQQMRPNGIVFHENKCVRLALVNFSSVTEFRSDWCLAPSGNHSHATMEKPAEDYSQPHKPEKHVMTLVLEVSFF